MDTQNTATAEVYVQSGGAVYGLPVHAGLTLVWQAQNAPGKLQFSVPVKDAAHITTGSTVQLRVNGANVFLGYVFSVLADESGAVQVTAYDQLRYFKNKDTYVYTNKTAGELVSIIANDFKLKTGALADTGYKIAQRAEDNKTLFDIVQTALSLTFQAKNKLFVLLDDCGALVLRNVANMRLPLLLDGETAQGYAYLRSIDSATYNKIKLVYANARKGIREVTIAQDAQNISRWGVLQHYGTLQQQENGRAKANALLAAYNREGRTLTVTGAYGDIRVRAGCSVWVQLPLYDGALSQYMLIESVRHTFSALHTMDLQLRGGDFYG